MRRRLISVTVVCLAVGLLALLAFGVLIQGSTSSIDSQVARGAFPKAPNQSMDLPLLAAQGSESLAALRGKVVVLNVWASWCGPCKAEAPLLEQAQRQLVHHDATILGVTYLDNSSDSEQFARQYRLTFPIMRDVNGNFVRAFGTNAVPETFVINRQGRIVALRRFQLNRQWLSRTLSPILTES
jgi:cytochrome c biogenesis protein CcmG/thiol:disulfide interchange protein DsbE